MGYDESIALVLSGGGAKGAYQAGVWRAMCETGVAGRVAAISGTSAGAINAAAFAMIRDPAKIQMLWHDGVSRIVTPNFKALTPENAIAAIENFTACKSFPLQGLLDRDALGELLTDALAGATIWQGAPSVYATSLECHGESFQEFARESYSRVCFRLDTEKDVSKLVSRVLASCSIPMCFSPMEIDGKRYVDGGWDAMGGENVPLSPIFTQHRDVSSIVVIRCNSKTVEPVPLKMPRGRRVAIREIRPKQPLPGIFDWRDSGSSSHAGMASGTVKNVFSSAFAGLFAPDKAEIWGATLAFSPAYTDQYFALGYEDGLEAFQEALSW